VSEYSGGTAYDEGNNWVYKAVVQDGAGLTVTDTGYVDTLGHTIWQCEITLPTPQTLEADTRYWLAWATTPQANWLAGDPGNDGTQMKTPVSDTVTGAGAWEGNVNNRLWGGGHDFYFQLLGPPAGLGDVDGNGVVDGLDLTAVITAWETTPGDPLWNPDADLDGNNVIDGLDLTEVISNWTTAGGAVPEPGLTALVGFGVVAWLMRRRT